MFLILDYGNVLTLPQAPEYLERMASLARQPLDDFVVAYWRHRKRLRGDSRTALRGLHRR